MKIVSRASRPGLLVGFLRILCDELCTAQTFHTVEHDHTCRNGCPDEPDSLTHYNECPKLHNIFLSFWRHAATLPQRNHFYMTRSPGCSCEAFIEVLWFWASLMLLFFFVRMRCPSKVHPQQKCPHHAPTQSGRHAQPHALKARLLPNQQGSCERSGRRACEHCTPPAKVGRFDPVLQNERRSLGLGSGQRSQELSRFFTPAAHFRSEDHQSSPPTLSRQFGTGSFFPVACLHQDRSVLVCSTKPSRCQGDTNVVVPRATK